MFDYPKTDGGDIQLDGFGDASDAREILTQAFDAYEKANAE